jgi:hypothetical protein
MNDVRRWYAAPAVVGSLAVQRGEHHLLDFPLSAPLAQEVSRIDSIPAIREALSRCEMTTEDWVVLTTAVGLIRLTLMLVDSLGRAGRPENVGENVLSFARSNRSEIDRLNSMFRKDFEFGKGDLKGPQIAAFPRRSPR